MSVLNKEDWAIRPMTNCGPCERDEVSIWTLTTESCGKLMERDAGPGHQHPMETLEDRTTINNNDTLMIQSIGRRRRRTVEGCGSNEDPARYIAMAKTVQHWGGHRFDDKPLRCNLQVQGKVGTEMCPPARTDRKAKGTRVRQDVKVVTWHMWGTWKVRLDIPMLITK